VRDYPALPDAIAPTVAITDNNPGIATGDVTFAFAFSESVGNTFTADDVVVTSGTKGAFARQDATHATLVVSPTANATGVIDLSVAAGSFSDAAGNSNTVSASVQQEFDTVLPPPTGRVITFDEATPPALIGFGGVAPTIVVDPTNAANKVAQLVKGAGAPVWSGATISTLPNAAIERIALTATLTTLTARVWSPDAGTVVRLKVENSADGALSVETDAVTTVAGGWETLTFDMANQAAGTPALDPALTYDKVSIFFDFGTVGTGKTYYLDDLDLTPTGS
jgi:hypothetical protein